MQALPLQNQPKILLLGSQMETGGAQQNLLSQAAWFHQHGYAVSTAFLYDKEGLGEKWRAEYSFPIIDLKARRWQGGKLENLLRLVGGLWRTFALIKRGKYMAIETFTHHANLAGIPLAWLAGVPVRMASHRGRFKTLTRYQERLHAWVINSSMATCLVANSQDAYKKALEEGIHAEKILIIANGIRIMKPIPDARKDVRKELRMGRSDLLVLSVGRLRYEKGHTFLLQAAAKVLEKEPCTRFVIAGDGTLRGELEEEARRLKIEGQVDFLGTREDAGKLMAAADVFALPSRSEGMPNALLEAMALGCAVVSTRAGGAEEVVWDGANGILVDTEDADSLAMAIIRLLRDKTKRRKLGEAARRHIAKTYNLDEMCRRYAELLIPETGKYEDGYGER